MTMHAIRGPASDHQLGLCMVAMRALATMYTNAEWVRNIFQKLGDRKRGTGRGGASTAPTRAATPARRPEAEPQHVPGTPPVSAGGASGTGVTEAAAAAAEPSRGFGVLGLQVPGLGGAGSLDQMRAPDDLSGWVGPSTEAGLGLGLPEADVSILYPQCPMETERQGYQDATGLGGCWDDLLCSDVSFDNPFILR